MTESGDARVLSYFGTRTIGAFLNFALSHTTQSQLRQCVTLRLYSPGACDFTLPHRPYPGGYVAAGPLWFTFMRNIHLPIVYKRVYIYIYG